MPRTLMCVADSPTLEWSVMARALSVSLVPRPALPRPACRMPPGPPAFAGTPAYTHVIRRGPPRGVRWHTDHATRLRRTEDTSLTVRLIRCGEVCLPGRPVTIQTIEPMSAQIDHHLHADGLAEQPVWERRPDRRPQTGCSRVCPARQSRRPLGPTRASTWAMTSTTRSAARARSGSDPGSMHEVVHQHGSSHQ